jgi:hypothetical protein
MYQAFKSPVFPKIEILDQTTKPEKNGDSEDSLIYSLDWLPKETYIKNQYKQNKGNPHWVYYPLFPENYRGWLYSFRFKLSYHYLNEIRYQCTRGMEEWNREYGMDTVVSDHLVKSAVCHFNNAFYLLADCLISPNDCYTTKLIAEIAMKIYFWDDQTGKGLVLDHAGFDRFPENGYKSNKDWIFARGFKASVLNRKSGGF